MMKKFVMMKLAQNSVKFLQIESGAEIQTRTVSILKNYLNDKYLRKSKQTISYT